MTRAFADIKCDVALGSYSRSGTTWVRYCLEFVTGRPAVSVQYDKPGWDLPVSGDPIIAKTRLITPGRWKKAVWLVRHPYDAILSYYDYLHNYSKERPTWDAHVESQWTIWRDINQFWETFPGGLMVRYEDLMRNPVDGLNEILRYLRVSVPEEKIREAVEKARPANLKNYFSGNYFPRGEGGHGGAKMGFAQKKRAQELIGPQAERYGYTL